MSLDYMELLKYSPGDCVHHQYDTAKHFIDSYFIGHPQYLSVANDLCITWNTVSEKMMLLR
jgi:hypothetical protein